MKNQDNTRKVGREEREVSSTAVLTSFFDEFGENGLGELSGKKTLIFWQLFIVS